MNCKLFTFFFLLSLAYSLNSQTTLSVGDIAFLEFDADGDDVTILFLNDVEINTEIKFTDNAWNSSSLNTNEGTFTWTAPSAYSCGDVLNIDVGLGFSASGDNVFAYQGLSTSPNFLSGLHFNGQTGWQTSGSTNTNSSYLPNTLTNGTNAIAVDESLDNCEMSTMLSGTLSEIRTAVNTQGNWTTTSTIITYSSPGITITSGCPSACTAPTVQPFNVTFANVTGTTMDINWTQGNGDGSMVVVRAASAISSTPANGTAYTANPIFGSGDDIGTNEFVVFRSGAASTVTVTGLSEATTYHVAIFEYSDTGDCYLLPSTAVGNQTTTCATPTEVMSPNAAPSNGAATITWNDASCFDEILVVASTASVTGIPLAANSGGYSANSQYGMGNGSPDFSSPEFPVFKAVSGNSIMVTGLTNSTQYFFKIFTRKGAVWSTGVEVNTTPLPVLFIEDFDDNTGSVTTNYSPSQFNFASGTDYFGVVCQNGNGCGNEIGSGISFTGGDGDSFLGAHDTDGGSAPMPSVTFEDINVSGAGTLYICFEIAEDDDGSNQDWDDDSSVSFEVDFDNAGSFGKVIQFSGGGATNTEPGVDSNCDGVEDGAAISDNFTTYCFGINGSGNTMDLRILITGLNAGDEDVAIDNIQLFDGDANLPVAATSSTCAAALPIELAFFRGEYIKNQVDLFWQTFSEINNDYFEIEHSLDGKEFSTIGMVEGNGTVYSSISYNFPHENPAVGMNYYRLKQFDFDGNFSYSNVVIIETERFDNEVSIFPNPFSNELTLQFTEENENVQTIQIVNLNGQVLFEKTAVLNSNETIDLAYLNNGIYFLRISDDKHSIIRKIEKF